MKIYKQIYSPTIESNVLAKKVDWGTLTILFWYWYNADLMEKMEEENPVDDDDNIFIVFS